VLSLNTESIAAPSPPWWQRIVVGRRPKWTLFRLVVLIVASLFLFKVALLPIQVQGISMLPTYHDGQINFINCLVYYWYPIQRGDVVGARYAGPHVMLLKRIIGLPGERIAIRRGEVFINGKILDEPYIRRPKAKWYEPEITLKFDEYYIIGDNREMPRDYHEHGKIKADRIVGKILF
jgi:signal peptidase I